MAGSSSIPTNDTRADQRYITLAWGADFADVVPLRGVILGGRGQSMGVAVSVIPEREEQDAPPLKGAPRGGAQSDRRRDGAAEADRETGGLRHRSRPMTAALAEPLSLQPIENHAPPAARAMPGRAGSIRAGSCAPGCR